MATLPLALGQRTFFFRDVFSNHLPLKAFGAQELRAGSIPAFNPQWGAGQPFRGNPSALAFYPDNLLYLALPFWSAFNLHFALHWLLAALGMAVLARRLGLGEGAALLAALAYGGSGWLLSGLSFYNLLTVAAWWPWVMAGAVRGDRRGMLLGGVACGLALLGGEPVTAALGLVPLLVAACHGRDLRRGLPVALAIGALGLLIALPQVVATARVMGFSFRSVYGAGASQSVSYSLHAARLLELLIPFPFGWPGHLGSRGFWAAGLAPRLPFFFSLYAGIVAFALAWAGRRRWAWLGLALGGLFLAWAGGLSGEWLLRLSGGLFRFPEKFLFWYALALPLLAGWGMERLLGGDEASSGRWRRFASLGGVVGLLAALAITVLRPWALRNLEGAPAGRVDTAALVSTQTLLVAAALALGGGLLLLSAWAVRRHSAASLVLLQGLAVLQLFPLWMTDSTEPYRQRPAWGAQRGSGVQLFNSALAFPEWHAPPRHDRIEGSKALLERAAAADLDPAPGALHGWGYPLAPNLEGLGTTLHTMLLFNLPRADWPARLQWMRLLGVEAAVLYEEPRDADGALPPSLTLQGREVRNGMESRLYGIADAAPEVWWPQRLVEVASPPEAFQQVAFAEDPRRVIPVERAVTQDPQGRVRLVESAADRLRFQVSSQGGVAVVRRAYHPLWRATAAGTAAEVFPVALCLTGVQVPPGEHAVELRAASALPEILAGLLALAVAALALIIGLRGPRILGQVRNA